MPFTLSHPLFVAPLKKVIPSLSLTGLILGSMAPDMEYFIAMQPFRSIGHHLSGFFLIALPVCIAVAIAFHRLIKPAMAALLPNFGGINRFAAYLNRPWKMATAAEWLMFFLSLFIGFYSHVVLDSFTHSSGWFVQRLPFLQSVLMGDEVHHIFQLSLSVLGALIPGLYFLYSYLNWYKKHKGDKSYTKSRSAYVQWVLFVFLTLALLMSKLAQSGDFFSISIWVVAPITSALIALYTISLLQIAIQAQRITSAILFAFLLAAVICSYKLLTHNEEFSLTAWVAYQWSLSAVIIISSIIMPHQK